MLAALARGKAQLAAVRKGRPYPGMASVAALSWRAETIRWLYEASTWGVAIDKPALATALDTLTASMGECGFARADGMTTLEDQAAMLRALQIASRVDEAEQWQERASLLGAVIVTRYVRDGVAFSTPADRDEARECHDVVDGEIPATLPNVIAGLHEVADQNGDAALRAMAESIAARSAGQMERAGVWAASGWK
jgi:uncharacterized protein YyaL (SSP411 family)